MNTFSIRLILARRMPAALALVPISLLSGCNSPSSSEATGAATTASSTSSSTSVASTSVAPSSATMEPAATSKPTQAPALTAVKTAKTVTKAKAAKPKIARPAMSASPYRVVDEMPDGATPDVAQAMRSTKVPPPPMAAVPAMVRVRLVTSKGPIVLALNGKAAPHHVRSFVYLSRRGFYNGTTFHRYADLLEGSGQKGPIIQGGDPLSRKPQTLNYAGIGGPGYQVPRERNNLKHDKLVIAAARSQDPDSAGSQFYITQAPVYFLDEGDGYTVFGKVVEGAANALKLAQGDKITRVEVLK